MQKQNTHLTASHVGLSGVSFKQQIAELIHRLTPLSKQLDHMDMSVINAVFPQRVKDNIPKRGGNNLNPLRTASDQEIRAMFALSAPFLRHGMHYSPLNAHDALHGPTRLWELFGPVDYFQISQPTINDNESWAPHLIAFRELTKKHQDQPCQIILQIGPQLLDGVTLEHRHFAGLCKPGCHFIEPERLVAWLTPLASLNNGPVAAISGVLIDRSASRGQLFDPLNIADCLLALQEQFPQLARGVAGGLSGSPYVVENYIAPILNKGVQRLFIDAATKLGGTDGRFSPIRATTLVQATVDLMWTENAHRAPHATSALVRRTHTFANRGKIPCNNSNTFCA